MLGSAIMYSKTKNGQRRKIDIDCKDKENIKRLHMIKLTNKYFNKIVHEVIKNIYNNKKQISIYYNYYDLTNERIGKPKGLLNEWMHEMCYELSEYVYLDEHDNPMTFKTLFGYEFKWELIGKNKIVISI